MDPCEDLQMPSGKSHASRGNEREGPQARGTEAPKESDERWSQKYPLQSQYLESSNR